MGSGDSIVSNHNLQRQQPHRNEQQQSVLQEKQLINHENQLRQLEQLAQQHQHHQQQQQQEQQLSQQGQKQQQQQRDVPVNLAGLQVVERVIDGVTVLAFVDQSTIAASGNSHPQDEIEAPKDIYHLQ